MSTYQFETPSLKLREEVRNAMYDAVKSVGCAGNDKIKSIEITVNFFNDEMFGQTRTFKILPEHIMTRRPLE